MGRTVAIEYDVAVSRPVRLRADGLTGPLLATYTYNPAGKLWKVTYPDGSGYEYTYLGDRIETVKDLEGKMVEAHTYHLDGRTKTSKVGDDVELLEFTYYSDRTVVVDALLNATTYWFANVRGTRRVTEVEGPCQGCGGGVGAKQRWSYDAYGRITAYIKGPGLPGPPDHTWRYQYDSVTGDLLKEIDPRSRETVYTYDAQGRVLTVTNPDGGLREYVQGPAGPTKITEKVTATTSRETDLTYTTHGKLQTITDPRDKVTTLTYDPVTADLLTVTAPPVAGGDPRPIRTTYTYYPTGRVWTVKDAVDNVTTYRYDGHGRLDLMTNPDNKATSFGHDDGGRRTTVTDALNRLTGYAYDNYGRLEKVTDARLGETRYGYDDMSNLTSLTDARNKTTIFEYDAYNRVKKVIYPGTPVRFETFTYDAYGRLETHTDRRGVTATYTYDEADRLERKTYSNGTPAVTYTYDPMDRLLSASNGTDTLTWTYDLAGQLRSEASSRTGSLIEYGYDDAGNRTSLKRNGQLVVNYEYDDASRLQYIRRGTSAFEFKYDAASRRTDLIGPRFASTSYGYDVVSRLLSQATTVLVPGNPPASAASSTYTYDSVGNRLTKGGDVAETYVYDELYRVTDATRAIPTEHYEYDPVGNRKRTIAAGPDWTYSDRNELLTNGSGGSTFTYDLNGNLETRTEAGAVWIFEWDAENRLTRVTNNGSEVARFAYDPLGRRVEKVAPGPKIHTYVYDGEDILWQDFTSVIVEEGMLDQPPHLYIHGPGIDEPLAVEHGNGAVWYYHTDGLGSVVRATDATGAPVHARRYDAFGQPQDGAEQAGYAYTGRDWDPETGLYYYRARYYDPKSGRFISEDPSRFQGGVNFFTYVGNNPPNFVDPEGLMSAAAAAALTTGWTIALCEPTPIGEVAMALVTMAVLTSQQGDRCNSCQQDKDRGERDRCLKELLKCDAQCAIPPVNSPVWLQRQPRRYWHTYNQCMSTCMRGAGCPWAPSTPD